MEYGVIKLANRGDRSRVLTGVCSTREADSTIRNLLHPEVPYFQCRGREGNDPSVVAGLYRIFRQFRPDVVHTHSWGTLIEGMLAARFAGVPRLVHGEHGTLQTRPYQRWIQRFAWGRADRLLSVSTRLAERLARDVGFPRSRMLTIRNGVDLDRFATSDRAAARQALEVGRDVIAVGTVGRLVPVKDHPTLLAAFALTLTREPRAMLYLAGDGPLRASLVAQAAALGIGERVVFLGHRPDVERVLAALDIFVLSSVSEGMSNTILEAMASGLPVVATAVGGADELVVSGRTGLLVPPADAARFADALTSLAVDSARRAEMGAAARQRAVAEFSLQQMIANYERLYTALRDGTVAHAAPGVDLAAERAATTSRTVNRP